MAEKKADKTVTLTTPNGQQVTVAESKQAALVAAGYQVPSTTGAAKSGKVSART